MKKLLMAYTLLLIVACSNQQKASYTTASYTAEQIAGFKITAGQGLGPVRFGMERGEVTKTFGPAEQALTKSADEYLSLGMAVIMDKDNKVGAFVFGNINADANDPLVQACKFKTEEGIGMGSTSADIKAAYGPPQTSSNMMEYLTHGMQFTLRDDHVVHLSLYRVKR